VLGQFRIDFLKLRAGGYDRKKLPQEFIFLKSLEFRLLWGEQNIIALNWDNYFYGACKNKIRERGGEFLTMLKQRVGGCQRA